MKNMKFDDVIVTIKHETKNAEINRTKHKILFEDITRNCQNIQHKIFYIKIL